MRGNLHPKEAPSPFSLFLFTVSGLSPVVEYANTERARLLHEELAQFGQHLICSLPEQTLVYPDFVISTLALGTHQMLAH